MLLRLTVGNYSSINENQSIDFQASSIRENYENNVFDSGFREMRLLKAIGLFGHNASGKSNIIKALRFIRSFATESATAKQITDEINVQPFKFKRDSISKPSYFQIEFLLDGVSYRYGLEVDRHKVHAEWLYSKKINKETLLFIRKQDEYVFGPKLEMFKDLVEFTRRNASYLSMFAHFNHPTATRIITWLRSIRFLSDKVQPQHKARTAELFQNPEYKAVIRKLFANADLGFNDIRLIRTGGEDNIRDINDDYVRSLYARNADSYMIKTIHRLYNEDGGSTETVELDFSEESDGTQRFFAIVGRMAEVLVNGGQMVIDEIDTQLHSILSESIISYFNSRHDNPKNAQILFVSHNTNLLNLNLMRRDQIYLVSKDKQESTRVQNLLQHEKVRNDINIAKAYLEGRFGGISTRKDTQLPLFE